MTTRPPRRAKLLRLLRRPGLWARRFVIRLSGFYWVILVLGAVLAAGLLYQDYHQRKWIESLVEQDSGEARARQLAQADPALAGAVTPEEMQRLAEVYVSALEWRLTGQNDRARHHLEAIRLLYPRTSWARRAGKVLNRR